MTVEQSTRQVDPTRLAAAARSILACPLDVELVVDGVDDVTLGLDEGTDAAQALEMRDIGGRPVFSCSSDSALAEAAEDERGALITLTSGVGAPGSSAREASITLAGTLVTGEPDECPCCDQLRSTVELRLDYVLLARNGGSEAERVQYRVPLAAFTSPAHVLNRGFLQRSVEHANRCHQDELRHAVATTSNTRLAHILGVQLAGLRPDRVEVQWVDVDGAHTRRLWFRRAATTPEQLGELLREELHAGLC